MSDLGHSLARLEEEERAVSRRRRRLHDRIDFVASGGGGGGGDESPAELLARLQAEEREVSQLRRELHARIDELRAQAAPRQGGAPAAPAHQGLDIASDGAYAASLRLERDPGAGDGLLPTG